MTSNCSVLFCSGSCSVPRSVTSSGPVLFRLLFRLLFWSCSVPVLFLFCRPGVKPARNQASQESGKPGVRPARNHANRTFLFFKEAEKTRVAPMRVSRQKNKTKVQEELPLDELSDEVEEASSSRTSRVSLSAAAPSA